MQYRFDKFVLDSEQLYLTVDDKPVDADARQLQLISLLIQCYPDCCEHDALLAQLWPSTVVSQWSLGRLVSDTRKLFRELGYEGPVIQTLHGRGYRLSPELAEQLLAGTPEPEMGQPAGGRSEVVLPEPALPPAGKSAAPAPVAPAPIYRRLWLGMGLLVLITALVVYLVTARRIPDNGAPLVIGEAADVRGRILWVDDHPGNNLSERSHFESLRIAVYIATNTEDALTLLSMYRYDAVISDMGRGSEPLAGFKLMEQLRARRDQTPYFLYTIMPSESQRALVKRRGGNGVAVTSDELYGMLLPLFERPLAEPLPAATDQ
ncbi:response regulator [uncultured Microbulbifer sp.]|uniref:response regulator n=1 Tax=uncultured Microbulbifer sp. TaxID=348147 RepID=UPI0026165C26|nr:response regulator [uncultured Microbulbifer sp.]